MNWPLTRGAGRNEFLPAFHALAAREPERVKLVDGRADVDTIERQVWSIIGAYV